MIKNYTPIQDISNKFNLAGQPLKVVLRGQHITLHSEIVLQRLVLNTALRDDSPRGADARLMSSLEPMGGLVL